MHRLLLLPCLAMLAVACWTPHAHADSTPGPVLIKGHLAHPTRILARRAAPTGDVAHATALAMSGMRVVRTSSLVPGLVVLDEQEPLAAQGVVSAATAAQAAAQALPADHALLARIEALRASGLYTYVEPDYLVFGAAVPTDGAFTAGTLWGLRNTGQGGGVAGVDIGAEAAWDVTTGSSSVVVAVIDSGARLTHTDLAPQLWRNPGEIAGNGRDDDNNGYVDDVHGINAINNNGNPTDDLGHGTHVAGTIGAAANGGGPMVGVAWQVRLMICKFLSGDDGGLTSDAIECIAYASARGARVLNCSWGSGGFSRSLHDAIAAARASGALVVVSAGNDGINNDQFPGYPSNFDLDNIIAVAAHDRWGNRASFSNYGTVSVDLAAPGDAIYSTVNDNNTAYATYSGTSMAAPHVSGVAALILAAHPSISVTDLRDRLIQTAVPTGDLVYYVASGGRLHAHRALTQAPGGQLALSVAPASGTIVYEGSSLLTTVRVTDLVGVRGATVTASVSGGASVTFRDDGVAPDTTADDANYMAAIAVPPGLGQLTLDVTASAPGKTTANRRVSYTTRPPPPNDMFSARIALAGVSETRAQSNGGASREAGEPEHAGDTGGASVWWTWTAPGDGTVTIDTVGSDFDTTLGVYTGSALGALTEVASNDDIDGPNQPSRVSFAVVNGTVLQIAVDGFGGATGNIQLNLNAAVTPPNDRFDRAVAITGSHVTVAGSTQNSTLEPGEPNHGVDYNSPSGSVWWAWTAPSDGVAAVTTSSSGNWGAPQVAVYAGGRLDALTRAVGRTDDRQNSAVPRITFGATAGQTYMIAVPHYGYGVEFSMTVDLTAGPANDNFVRRIAVSGDSLVITGDVSAASREAGEPGLPGPGRGSSLWWSWTPATSGTARLLTTGSVGRPTIGVFTGEIVSGLQVVTGDLDGYGDPNYAFLEWRVAAGSTYHIVADSYMGATSVRMAIQVLARPANDDFSNRIQLTGTSVSVSASNDGAGREPGEPDHLLGGQPPPRPAHATLWWGWTAPADGTAVFEGDGIVTVYTGSSVGALTPVPDADQATYDRRRVVAHVTGGVQYQVARDGVGYTRGVLPLSIQWHPSPANDMFANRAVLTGTSADLTGDATYATIEPGESTGFGSQHGTLWWTWTAPISGTALFSTTTNQMFAVYTGGEISALTAVVSRDYFLAGSRRVQFLTRAGQAYQIAVSPTWNGANPISIQLLCVASPANDAFSARIRLAGGGGSVTGTTLGATREPDEPYTGGSQSVWWTWTTPTAGAASVSVDGSAFGALVRVWQGFALNGLTLVSEGNSATGSQPAQAARWLAIAGATYHISVDSVSDIGGDVALDYALNAVPENDSFARRFALSGTSFDVAGDNLGATAEPGEPSVDQYSVAYSTLWWRWTAPARGTFEVRTSSGGGRIAVFLGSVLSQLERLPDADSSGGRAVVHVEPGTEYQIAVDGGDVVERYSRSYMLTGELHSGPANDMFVDATVLSGTDASADGLTTLGTAERLEPNHGGGGSAASVWWTWTAPKSGRALVTTRDASTGHYLALYTGPDPTRLTQLASAFGFDASGVGLSFEAVAGSSYHIAVAERSDRPASFRLRVRQPEIPANDAFASRAVLNGSSGSVEGDNSGATIETGENHADSGGTPRYSVWWQWTAPSTGTATFSVRETVVSFPRLRAYTGTGLTSLVAVPNSFGDYQASMRFHAEAGVTYSLAFFDLHWTSVGGSFAFDFSLQPGPANDMFADAEVVTAAAAHFRGVGSLATREVGEYPVSSSDRTASLWWTWTVPRSGMASISLDSGGRSAYLALSTGATVSSQSVLDYRGGGTSARVTIRSQVTAGTTYRIRVDSPQGTLEAFTLDLAISDPPANDAFATRVALTGQDVSASADNRGATSESGEPYLAGGSSHASVWWTWTAPASGRTVVTTQGSSIHTMIGVYTGASLGALSIVDSSVEVDALPTGNNVVFDAVKDTTYTLFVDGLMDEVGDIALRVVMTEPPANDDFANRAGLTGESAVGHANTFGAMREPGEPLHASSSVGRTVWWSWTAPRSGWLRIRTAGSEIDTLAAVYTGSTIDYLTWILQQARTELPVGERDVDVDVEVTAGETYHIAVQGFGAGMGDVILSLDMYQAPQVQFDVAGGAFVAGQPGVVTASVTGEPALQYQWFRDGTAIPGETGATLSFASLQAFHAGSYTLRVTTWRHTVTSDPIVIAPSQPAGSDARVLNLSTRAFCQTGENVLISGFYVEGTGTKRLLMRAVGPELERFGVTGVLPDPQLTLRRASDRVILATNDDWGDGPATEIRDAGRAVYAFGLTDGSTSAALLMDLPAGGYTLTASGKGDETGVSIVELYEISGSSETSRLTNISSRGFIGSGGNIMIPGFIVSDEGPRTFLVRVVGPSLSKFDVQGMLADPRLEVYKRRPGTAIDDLILTNDTWGENGDGASIKAIANAVHAFSLLEDSKDAAFVVTLPPGAYTVNAKGVGDTTGVALVEVYLAP